MEKRKVIIAGVWERQDPDHEAQMKELESLAEACGLQVAERFTQRLVKRDPASYFGPGKLL